MKNNEKDVDYYLGEIFREQRNLNSLTQSDIAEHFGMTKQAISYYEKGLRSMNASMFFRWCDYLGLDCNWVSDEIDRRMNNAKVS